MGCAVLRHAVNQGKGRALKTAFNYCLNTWPELEGCVTADSDGQHSAECVHLCARALIEHPDCLVLGCRDFFEKQVPRRNRMGNLITSFMFKALCGMKVSDTQTGLRAIPAAFMKRLMAVSGERFEFETNMLLDANSQGVEIYEVPIQTIYQGEQYTSHFNPVTDSIKVYKVLGKFIFSSLFSSVVDYVLFFLLVQLLRERLAISYILVATIAARAVSSALNFLINKKLVFKSRASTAKSVGRYTIVAVCIMLCSAVLVTAFQHLVGGKYELIIKLIVDGVLFVLSFFLQREFVFKKKKQG